MTQLFLPDVLQVMETEGMMLDFKPKYEAAAKYVFESDGDLDPETVKNIHLTSEEMIEAGLFHLPFPSVWIEDPWPKKTVAVFPKWMPEGRQFWYCEEEAGRIKVWAIRGVPPAVSKAEIDLLYPSGNVPAGKYRRKYIFHTPTTDIDLSPERTPIPWAESFDSPLHSIRQFVVTLATAQADVEIVPGKPFKPKQPLRTRQYEHRVLRILLPGETRHGVANENVSGHKRKLHFVAGYIWGKNTRSKEQQRWIAPYYRGDVSEGVSLARHREIVRVR